MSYHVLVVDDEEIVLTGLAANLEQEGYRVSTATSAHEAMDLLARTPVDLVLTDLIMEDMDGLALLRRLNEQMPDLPVIVITGHGTATSALEAVRRGAADYIQKPARPEEIAHRIQTVLDAHQLQRRLVEERDHARERREGSDVRAARAERMASIRLMSEGLGEEVQAIAAPLQQVPESLAALVGPEHPAQAWLGECRRAAERAAELLRDLRHFDAAPPARPEPVNLNDLVGSAADTPAFRAWRDASPAVHVDVRLKDGLPPILGEPAVLRPALLTMIGAAFDAVHKGGRLMIATGLEIHQQPVGHMTEAAAGAYAYVRVLHSGFIDKDDLDHVFEPYYACRRMGRVSAGGFGLTRVYSCVRAHGGFIQVHTDPHVGTETAMHLPVPESAPQGDEKTSLTMLKGSEEILVVDDGDAHRAEAVCVLKDLGYEVYEVTNGAEALALVAKRSRDSAKPFDLVVLDLVLGDALDGVATFRRILEIQPDQKAILAGGFAETDRISEGRRLGIRAYVKKPYTRDNLGRVVRDVLDRE